VAMPEAMKPISVAPNTMVSQNCNSVMRFW
jgi:hypothetical protein